MSFELTEEQRILLQTVRRMMQEKVAPKVEEIEEKGVFPWEIWELYRENGIVGIPFPEEYGGTGLDTFTFCLVLEEIAKVCNNSASILLAQTLGSKPILIAGTPTQKEKYIPPIARGDHIVSFGLTEPGAGSDAGAITTKAVLDKDYYIIDGSKHFISNADSANVIVLFAKTNPAAGVKGISAFIIEKGTPGLSIGKKEKKMSGKPLHACEVVLENCRVPKENLLGKEGEGFKIAVKALDSGRAAVAARAVGLAQGALDYAVEYAKQRVQFGQPIAKFQAIEFMIADMATEIEAARQLTYKACAEIEKGSPDAPKYGAMAKYFATDVAMKVTTDAVQILGGYGYMEEYPLARAFKNAKLSQIIEGTNQIQRMVVARSIIGRI